VREATGPQRTCRSLDPTLGASPGALRCARVALRRVLPMAEGAAFARHDPTAVGLARGPAGPSCSSKVAPARPPSAPAVAATLDVVAATLRRGAASF